MSSVRAGKTIAYLNTMALRNPISRNLRSLSHSSLVRPSVCSGCRQPWPFQGLTRTMASVTHPVTQDATSSKGPTAMVFMNMGGPSTTDEVGDFLSRLFVRHEHGLIAGLYSRTPKLIITSGRCRSHTARSAPVLSRSTNFSSPHAQDPEAICCHRWRLAHSQVVGTSVLRDV